MIFDRNSDAHPFEPQVSEWLDMRAIALNLVHDHRVSKDRENRLLKCFHCRNKDLKDTIQSYFLHQVRRGEPPDFLQPAVNAHNIITGKHPNDAAMAPEPGMPSQELPLWNTRDLLLVHALIINGLQEMLKATKERRLFTPELLLYFPDGLESPDFERSLNEAMTPGLNKPFVEFVLKVIEFWTPGYTASPEIERYAFHPEWVALWDEYRDFAQTGGFPLPADRWLQALGIRPSRKPEWVILLVYSAQEAGNLVRPTQLDAGWYMCHFPSPRNVDPVLGGFPVDLGNNGPRRLISEYIHQQISHPPAHYHRMNCLFGRTTPLKVDLPRARQRHHRRLIRRFGSQVREWMPDPA